MTPDARRADSLRWQLRQVEGSPAERKQRQLEVLMLVRRVLEREYEHVPIWWAELRKEVREGRL